MLSTAILGMGTFYLQCMKIVYKLNLCNLIDCCMVVKYACTTKLNVVCGFTFCMTKSTMVHRSSICNDVYSHVLRADLQCGIVVGTRSRKNVFLCCFYVVSMQC